MSDAGSAREEGRLSIDEAAAWISAEYGGALAALGDEPQTDRPRLILAAEDMQLLDVLARDLPPAVADWLTRTSAQLDVREGQLCVLVDLPYAAVPAVCEWLASDGLRLITEAPHGDYRVVPTPGAGARTTKEA